MTTTASIVELLKAGVTLEAGEAVAVTQQLIQWLRTCSTSDLQPPFGPPTTGTVVLGLDGSVTCASCGSTPAISEVAIFLDTLLPAGSPRVPGGLRYAIARALLEVDVAPFDSLAEFSEALARYERGDRREIVQRLVQRSESACAMAVFDHADRRRPRASATDLRRALREADARLYAQRAALPPAAPGRRSGMRHAPAIAACLGSGLMLVAAGEFMHRSELPATAAASIVAPVATPAILPPPTAASSVGTLNEQTSPTSLVGTLPTSTARSSLRTETSVPAPRLRSSAPAPSERPPASRPARATTKIKKAGAGTQRRNVLDRMKLKWLRKAFVIRVDEL